MAELADAQVSGSCGRPCRFNSCYPHQNKRDGKAVPFILVNLNNTGVEGRVRQLIEQWTPTVRAERDEQTHMSRVCGDRE